MRSVKGLNLWVYHRSEVWSWISSILSAWHRLTFTLSFFWIGKARQLYLFFSCHQVDIFKVFMNVAIHCITSAVLTRRRPEAFRIKPNLRLEDSSMFSFVLDLMCSVPWSEGKASFFCLFDTRKGLQCKTYKQWAINMTTLGWSICSKDIHTRPFHGRCCPSQQRFFERSRPDSNRRKANQIW